LTFDISFSVTPGIGANEAGKKHFDIGIGFGRDKSLRYIAEL